MHSWMFIKYYSLKKEKAEMNEEFLTNMSDVFLEKLKDQLRQKCVPQIIIYSLYN